LFADPTGVSSRRLHAAQSAALISTKTTHLPTGPILLQPWSDDASLLDSRVFRKLGIRYMHRRRTGPLHLLAAGSACWAAAAASAEQQARLTIEITVTGNESAGAGPGSDWGKATISQHYRLETTVKTDGVLSSVNAKDPQYAEKALAQAARDRARIRAVQQRLDAAGVGAPPPSSAGADAPVADVDLDAEEPAPDERYLTYIGWIGCPSEIAIRIDDRLEGAYADVAGMVPYTQSYAADWSGTATDRTSLCVHYTVVLDTKARMLYTDGLALPQIMGTATYTEPSRAAPVQRTEEPLPGLPPAAAEFVQAALLVRPLSGSTRGTVTLAQPYLPRPPIQQYSGQVDVELSWTFAPL
jgi:hypothetical protein